MIANARHLDMHDYARDMIRAHRNDAWLAAKLLARQAARENWTQEAVYEARDAFTWDAMVLFDSEYAKFRTDSRRIAAVGTTDEQGFLNILQSGPTGEIYDTWIYPRQERLIAEGRMYATETPWPLHDPKVVKRATETLTPRMTGYSPVFTLCENENCRANCCK